MRHRSGSGDPFVQPEVAEHLSFRVDLKLRRPYGELSRMTQFKEKGERAEYVNTGLSPTRCSMAADILLYRATRVPVGEDQIQHLELTREIVRHSNNRWASCSKNRCRCTASRCASWAWTASRRCPSRSTTTSASAIRRRSSEENQQRVSPMRRACAKGSRSSRELLRLRPPALLSPEVKVAELHEGCRTAASAASTREPWLKRWSRRSPHRRAQAPAPEQPAGSRDLARRRRAGPPRRPRDPRRGPRARSAAASRQLPFKLSAAAGSGALVNIHDVAQQLHAAVEGRWNELRPMIDPVAAAVADRLHVGGHRRHRCLWPRHRRR